MTLGHEGLRKFQVGLEGTSTPGTAVAANTIIPGTFEGTPEMGIHMFEEHRGTMSRMVRDAAIKHDFSGRFSSVATYNQLAIFLNTCIDGTVAKADSGASSSWTYVVNPSAIDVPDTLTVEFGDNIQGFKAAYVFCSTIELGLQFGGPLSLSAEMVGRFPEKTAFATVADPGDQRAIITDTLKVWIDTTWANVGTTLMSNLVAGGSIRITNGFAPLRLGGGIDAAGRYNFTTVAQQKRDVITIDLDLIVSDAMIAQMYDAYLARTDRSIRLKFEEGANSIETGKSHYLNIDAFGRWTNIQSLYTTADGLNAVRATFTSFDDGSNNEATITLRNKTAGSWDGT